MMPARNCFVAVLLFASLVGCSSSSNTGTSGSGTTTSGSPSSASTGLGTGAASGLGTGPTTGATSGSGSGGSTTSGGTSGISSSAACTNEATALCEQYAACSAGWYIDVNYGSLSTCITRETLSCTLGLAAPGTSQTPARVEACALWRSTEACSVLYNGADSSPCTPTPGTLQAGSPCQESSQCASGYCAIASDALCGACMPLPTSGSDCSVYPCGPGLHCLAATQQCQAPLATGASCTADSDCEFGDTCLTETQVCAVTVDGGQPCTLEQNAGPGCNDDLGLICAAAGDAGLGTCQQKPLAGAGQPCGELDGPTAPFTNCEDHGYCQKLPGASAATCVAVASDNGACQLDAGPSCLPPARCVPTGNGATGVCQLPGSMTCGETTSTTAGSIGSTGGTSGSTGTTGGSSGGGDGGQCSDPQFCLMGTFSGSAEETADMTATGAFSVTFAGLQSTLSEDLSLPPEVDDFDISAINGDGSSSAVFAGPQGITSYGVEADILFAGPPTAGMQLTPANSCGSILVNYGPGSNSFFYAFQATEEGTNCSITAPNGGSYTLTFTSVTNLNSAVGKSYTAHGTLQGVLPDSAGNMESLMLSF